MSVLVQQAVNLWVAVKSGLSLAGHKTLTWTKLYQVVCH